jgi:hypothetical protein
MPAACWMPRRIGPLRSLWNGFHTPTTVDVVGVPPTKQTMGSEDV